MSGREGDNIRVQMLWGKRKSEQTLELMTAWDEDCIDANPEGWQEDMEERKQAWGDDLEFWNVIVVDLPYSHLSHALRRPTLALRVAP